MWIMDTIKQSIICIMGGPEGEKKEEGMESLLKK